MISRSAGRGFNRGRASDVEASVLRTVTLVLAAMLLATPARAQHENHQAAPDTGWGWSVDSNVFLTGNFQVREFRDFHQIESQNWVMGEASRNIAGGTFALHGMLSFEPFTLRELGSSQVFQTGETFDDAPLIDYQHPHDLVMAMSAAYERPVGGTTVMLRAGLVDAPALGPTVFMHRRSSFFYPTAPLSHHQLDSTHITHGVLTGAVRAGVWQLEGSAFQGREPDEDRVGIDIGALDSYATRLSWLRGGTRVQVSAGWLNEPDVSEPGDVTRVTASIEHTGPVAGRAASLTVAFGENREAFSTEDALLTEFALGLSERATGYLRGEMVEKHILEAGGLHPVGLQHPHILSKVWALTGGYQHALLTTAGHRFLIGGDITGHVVPQNLREAYGRPTSMHLYGRWVFQASH